MSVTVIIAAHNEQDNIVACLNSVTTLCRPDDRIIVVDDGSTDGTRSLVTGFHDRRLRCIGLAESVGRAAARNLAIQESDTPFIAVQDADDIALPRRLAAPIEVMQSERVVASSGQCVTVTRGGRRWIHATFALDAAKARASLARGEMPLCHTGSVFRRQAVLDVGGYDSQFIRSQDFDLVRRLASVGDIACSSEYTVLYHHEVLLSWSYWSSTRRYRRLSEGRKYSTLEALVKYCPSMLARVFRFMRTTKFADQLPTFMGWNSQ